MQKAHDSAPSPLIKNEVKIMLSVNSQTIGFDSVAKSVKEITDTKNTFRIDVSDQDIMNTELQ